MIFIEPIQEDTLKATASTIVKATLAKQSSKIIMEQLENVYTQYKKCKPLLQRNVRKPLNKVFKAYVLWKKVVPTVNTTEINEVARSIISGFVDVSSMFIYAVLHQGYLAIDYKHVDQSSFYMKVSPKIIKLNREIIILARVDTPQEKWDSRRGFATESRIKNLKVKLDKAVGQRRITKEMISLAQEAKKENQTFSRYTTIGLLNTLHSIVDIELKNKPTNENKELYSLNSEIGYIMREESYKASKDYLKGKLPRKFKVTRDRYQPAYYGDIFI